MLEKGAVMVNLLTVFLRLVRLNFQDGREGSICAVRPHIAIGQMNRS